MLRDTQVHVVQFDQSSRISQIRLYWDQGSLLKTVDIIGARGRNWPVKDCKDHVRLVSTSVATAGKGDGVQTKRQGDVVISSIPTSPRKSNASDRNNDQNFFERHANEQVPIIAPKSSSFKQSNVEYGELLAGGESDMATEAGSRASSPTKQSFGDIAPKGGAGKNFQPSRLFDADANSGASQKFMKPHPGKFDHFEFGDSSNQPASQPGKTRTKFQHQSQWGFEDFTTPVKLPPKPNKNAPSFNIGEKDDDSITPVNKPGRAGLEHRKKTGPQFELQDDGTPEGGRRPAGHPRGRGQSSASNSTYSDNYMHDSGLPPEQEKKSSAFQTAVNPKDRHKDFDAHFAMTDSSPAPGEKNATMRPPPGKSLTNKAAKTMEKQWEIEDPDFDRPLGIRTAGNGMGARKEATERDIEKPLGIRTAGNGMGAPKNLDRGVGKENVGIKTAGDGMGGKSGTGRSWGFGDESDEETYGKNVQKNMGRGRSAMNARQGGY